MRVRRRSRIDIHCIPRCPLRVPALLCVRTHVYRDGVLVGQQDDLGRAVPARHHVLGQLARKLLRLRQRNFFGRHLARLHQLGRVGQGLVLLAKRLLDVVGHLFLLRGGRVRAQRRAGKAEVADLQRAVGWWAEKRMYRATSKDK